MAGQDFTTNPCRRNIFDVFPVDKADTDMKNVREAMRSARDQWKFGHIVARDGTQLTLTEAELNAMERLLLDPVERLKAEQFVHQTHLFANDADIVRCVQQLEDKDDPIQDVLTDLQGALLAMVRHAIPPLQPPLMEDDLPWPPEPGPCDVMFEPLESAILRER